jgi:hypothetical protein
VNVDTASSGTEGKKELKLAGLKDPHSFKKLVWAMKRSQQGLAPAPMQIANHDAGNQEDVTSLLKEIRDELRTNNELLKQTKATAPYETADETEEPNIV